jgi:plasmid stabilization system protein ParE
VPTNVVDLHTEAATEYDATFDWYLRRSPDAALNFDSEVERAIGEIAQAPQRWARGPHRTRRFLLRNFPFLVIYRERSAGHIQIIAIAHTSRKPGYWKERM